MSHFALEQDTHYWLLHSKGAGGVSTVGAGAASIRFRYDTIWSVITKKLNSEKKYCIKEKWHKSIPHSEDDKEFRKPFYDQLVLIQSIKKACFRQCSEHSWLTKN